MIDVEEHFLEWINSNVSPYSFLIEYFYGEVETQDEKTRRKLMYDWLLTSYKEGFNRGYSEGRVDFEN